MTDYSRLGNLRIDKSGLLSKTSFDLKKFIIENRLERISEFIEKVDNNTYTSPGCFEVLQEARGLSDMLKRKYFNIPLETDIYLDAHIKYMEFDSERLASPINLYGIILPSHEKKNIYGIITRLGFNYKERDFILSTDISLEDSLVIDLLHDAHNREIKKGTDANVAFCNKIMIILQYYLVTRKNKNDSEFVETVEKAIEEFNDLLVRKNRLESELKRKNGVTRK